MSEATQDTELLQGEEGLPTYKGQGYSQVNPPAERRGTQPELPIADAQLVADEGGLPLQAPSTEEREKPFWSSLVQNKKLHLASALLIVLIAAVVGGVCGSGKCKPSDSGQQPFENKEELYEAVNDYLVDGSSSSALASKYGHPIGEWDVSRLKDFSRVFASDRNPSMASFDEDLGGWETSSATDMSAMFRGATSFTGNITNWDVSKVTNMQSMFSGASAFNQDLSGAQHLPSFSLETSNMFRNSGCPVTSSPDPNNMAKGPLCHECITSKPTASPTTQPSATGLSARPTTAPTPEPSTRPTASPTRTPTLKPTPEPTSMPTIAPTAKPGPAKSLVVLSEESLISTTSASYFDIPGMTADIVTSAEESILKITFEAEAYTSASSIRMFVKALVDDGATENVLFAYGYGQLDGTRSFSFLKAGVPSGTHRVRVQWYVDAGGTAYLGTRSLALHASSSVGLTAKLNPAGPAVPTMINYYHDMPEMSLTVNTEESDTVLAITFCSPMTTSSDDKRMFVRALVDDEVASPSDMVFRVGRFDGSRSFTFVQPFISPGTHTVKMQWLVDADGTALLDGDATILVLASPQDNSQGGGLVVRPGPSGVSKATTTSDWRSVPDLSESFFATADNTAIAITVSAEAETNSVDYRFLLRATIDSDVANPSSVVFAKARYDGSRSFTFVQTGLSSGQHNVEIQWRVDPGGTAYIGDRTIILDYNAN